MKRKTRKKLSEAKRLERDEILSASEGKPTLPIVHFHIHEPEPATKPKQRPEARNYLKSDGYQSAGSKSPESSLYNPYLQKKYPSAKPVR